MVFILARRQRGCTVICTCSTFTKLGTCCHELITRYLHVDKAIIMAPLPSMTHKNAVDLQAADEYFRQKKRAGRPAALPQQNALMTVNFKLLRVEQRQKKKKQAKDDAQEAQWKLFREGISQTRGSPWKGRTGWRDVGSKKSKPIRLLLFPNMSAACLSIFPVQKNTFRLTRIDFASSLDFAGTGQSCQTRFLAHLQQLNL